jgi:hypothetical protein
MLEAMSEPGDEVPGRAVSPDMARDREKTLFRGVLKACRTFLDEAGDEHALDRWRPALDFVAGALGAEAAET